MTGIPVSGVDGQAYDHPFLGGFDVPRPQLVDLDGDGDLDLFIQERTDELIHFENVGTPERPTFRWRTDRFQDLPIGEWSRFVDLDRDGDEDLLAESPFSYIRVFRNEGSATRPELVAATDSLRDTNGDALFSDRQNIPSITDIDCDGLWDLFVGKVEGVVVRYELEPASPAPAFRLVTNRFQDIEIVSQFGTLHGANSMAFVDVDRDGAPDLLWGDFFEPGLLLIRNTGSCEAPNLRGTPTPLPATEPISTSGFNAPMPGDLDADGQLDLLIGVLGGAFNPNTTSRDNLHHYERRDDGRFELRTRRFLGSIDLGSETLTRLHDLDGDGDLDLLVSNRIDHDDLQRASLYRFDNVGSPEEPRFRAVGTLPVGREYHMAPAFGDLDADGDADLLLGTWNQGVSYHVNEDGRYRLVDSTFVTLTRGSHSTPTLGDLDGDGDLDLLVGEASGTLNYYRNEGTPAAPDFRLVSDDFAGIDVGRRSVPTLLDVDGDRDLDLVVGRESGGIASFTNVGGSGEPRFVPGELSIPLPPFSTPAFGDLDGDGDQDVVSGTGSGGVIYFEARSRD